MSKKLDMEIEVALRTIHQARQSHDPDDLVNALVDMMGTVTTIRDTLKRQPHHMTLVKLHGGPFDGETVAVLADGKRPEKLIYSTQIRPGGSGYDTIKQHVYTWVGYPVETDDGEHHTVGSWVYDDDESGTIGGGPK